MAYTFTRTGAQIEEIHNTVDNIYNTLGNSNLLSNHNFLIQTPDDSQPLPSATPTSYPPGYQIFSGVFANETTGITNLTYIDGRVSFSGGDFYMSVPNTGALENITEFVASVADFDGKPRTRGVSYALVGDEYRVTVGVDALEDTGGNATLLGSVKFEQGSVATGHEVRSLSVGDLSDYTVIIYKANGGNSAVENMIAGVPAIAAVGDVCSTGRGGWVRISNGGTIADFEPLGPVYPVDFGEYDQGLVSISSIITDIYQLGSDVVLTEGDYLFTTSTIIPQAMSGRKIYAEGDVNIYKQTGIGESVRTVFTIEDDNVEDVEIFGFKFDSDGINRVTGFVYLNGGKRTYVHDLVGVDSGLGVVVIGSGASSEVSASIERITSKFAGRICSFASDNILPGNVVARDLRMEENTSLGVDFANAGSTTVENISGFRILQIFKQADIVAGTGEIDVQTVKVDGSGYDWVVSFTGDGRLFELDEVVSTGGGSTAVVFARQKSGLFLRNLSGAFNTGDVITGGTSGGIATLTGSTDGSSDGDSGVIYTTSGGFRKIRLGNVELLDVRNPRTLALSPTSSIGPSGENRVEIDALNIEGVGQGVATVAQITNCVGSVGKLRIKNIGNASTAVVFTQGGQSTVLDSEGLTFDDVRISDTGDGQVWQQFGAVDLTVSRYRFHNVTQSGGNCARFQDCPRLVLTDGRITASGATTDILINSNVPSSSIKTLRSTNNNTFASPEEFIEDVIVTGV